MERSACRQVGGRADGPALPGVGRGYRAAALALALAGGCAAPPARSPQPLLRVASEVHAGTLLSGPRPQPPAAPLADPWALEVAFAYAEELPSVRSEPLSASAREVVAEGAEPMLQARGELVLEVRRADGLHGIGPERWREERVEALWPGTTAIVRAEREGRGSEFPHARWERLALEVGRSAGEPGALEVALALEGWATPRPSEDELEHSDDSPARPPELAAVRRREQVVLERAPSPGAGPLVLLFPAPARTSPRGGFVVTLAARVPAADDAVFAARLESARAELEDSQRETHVRASLFTRPESFRAEVERALRDLEHAERPALLLLARSSAAPLAEDLALCADDATLAECRQFVRQRARENAVPADDPAAFGWFLERSVLAWLAARAGAEERALEPELESLLLRRTGELGRFPDLVLEAIDACAGLVALDEHLVRENLIFLEDAHPAARVRAFDWLVERDRAPEGYDPLASRDARRSALARAEDAANAAAEPEQAAPADAGGAR